jgi:hypothetical protein
MATMNATDLYEPYVGFFQGLTFYSTLNTSAVKNIFSAIYTVLGVAIAMIGSLFLKKRNLHKLISAREEDRIVAITEMTSWLSLSSSIKYIVKTRKLPGGIWGFIMIIAGAFALAHQFFVNSLIVNTSIYARDICTFSSGVITTKMSNQTAIPVAYFAAASTIYYAQVSVDLNNGAWGIWEKFDSVSDSFYPYDSEVLGRWGCTTNASMRITSDMYVKFLLLHSSSLQTPSHGPQSLFL